MGCRSSVPDATAAGLWQARAHATLDNHQHDHFRGVVDVAEHGEVLEVSLRGEDLTEFWSLALEHIQVRATVDPFAGVDAPLRGSCGAPPT